MTSYVNEIRSKDQKKLSKISFNQICAKRSISERFPPVQGAVDASSASQNVDISYT